MYVGWWGANGKIRQNEGHAGFANQYKKKSKEWCES
jgi:hypothetical protein